MPSADPLVTRVMTGDPDAARQLEARRQAEANTAKRREQLEAAALADYRAKCAEFAEVFVTAQAAMAHLAAAGHAANGVRECYRMSPGGPGQDLDRGALAACGRGLPRVNVGEALLAAAAGPLGGVSDDWTCTFRDVQGLGRDFRLPRAGGDG